MVGGGVEGETGVHLLCSFTHVAEAVAFVVAAGVEAFAVVVNADEQAFAVALDAELDVLRLGVAGDVVEGFFADQIELPAGLDVGDGQIVFKAGRDFMIGQQAFRERAQDIESMAVGDAGAQLEELHHVAHGAGAFAGGLLDGFEIAQQPGIRAGVLFGESGEQSDAAEVAADLVMQVAGETLAQVALFGLAATLALPEQKRSE